ncbi:hemerythrin domain-containing protein [Nonomuraea sp. NPDC050783]|uniref:hemerythrin domain-containing protein n=1 Tax=Nonomuraea sp. NPDC050783 TaxID=3154634 RepID=UPI003466EC12
MNAQHPDQRPDQRPDPRPDQHPDQRPDPRPGQHPGQRPDRHPDEQRLVAWGDELIKLHDAFRRDLAALRAAEPGRLPGGDLRTHCLAFCDALHAHHEGEDNALFPHLATEHPALADVLERLRAEHRVVSRLMDRIRRLLDGDGTKDASGDVADELARLADELEAHLDYEEEQLVPVLNRMTTLPENV